MRIALSTLAACIACLISPYSAAQLGNKNFNGELWKAMDTTTKLSWANGFVQGISLSSSLAPMYLCDGVKESYKCYTAGSETMERNFMGQFRGMALDQLTDGLDVFYSDYRNRQIDIVFATTYVAQSIKGKPAAELDKQIETLRKNAAKP
jgi:hypothetical protein